MMADRLLAFLLLVFLLHFAKGQIDTSQCGKTSCCFRFPGDCSGTSCSILISFKYNQTGVLDVEIGTKDTWAAFGLNNEQSKMDKTAGEVCLKTSSGVLLKGFANNGYTANFNVLTNGLNLKGSEVKNNFVVCRYSRPITPPSGSYMLDLNSNMYITAAFGQSLSGSNPGFHGIATSTTSSSPSKVDFKKPCSISGQKGSPTKIIAHGALMTVAWVCFAATGMFIARYTKSVYGDKKCFSQKVWFQNHRMFMTGALVLTIIGLVIIFVHRNGWSEGAGAHPILGCIVTFLAIMQPIIAAFRPHPEEENRWIFNIAHRTVGATALVLAAVTIMLGLNLFGINNVAIIIWIVLCVCFIVAMEIGIFVIGKSSASAEFATAKDDVAVNVVDNDPSITFRRIMFLLAIISFFALGFATVGQIAVKAS